MFWKVFWPAIVLNDHPSASFAQDNRILNRYGAKLFSAQTGPTFRATAHDLNNWFTLEATNEGKNRSYLHCPIRVQQCNSAVSLSKIAHSPLMLWPDSGWAHRVSQIDIYPANLHHSEIAWRGHAPQKIHPFSILVCDFVFHFVDVCMFPRFSLWCLFPLTDCASTQENKSAFGHLFTSLGTTRISQ